MTPNLTPSMYWAMKPSTKIGIAITTSVLAKTRLSMKPFLRTPARIPARIPITTSKAKAMRASRMVTGSLAASFSVTCWPRKSSPRSPVKSRPMYLTY